jgi:hypothetical protein
MKINESSGYSFSGSITPDLMISKIWLANKLLKSNRKFSNIYILGSWYGNMAYILHRVGVPYQKIINVDTNKDWLKFSDDLLKQAGIKRLQSMNKDANKLSYQQADKNSLVINTSENDIAGKNWWVNLPPGVMVAIQSRDQSTNQRYKNLREFDQAYPMSKTLFPGKLDLTDLETDYQRFMKIGIK